MDTYTAEHADEGPLICMDEAAKQMTSDVEGPIAMAPGRAAKEDYHYERHGVRAIFPFFDPIRVWRRVGGRDSRTRVDWAEEVRRLLDEDYPFPAEEAHRLARRLEIIPTPRDGSWLNVAEIEPSVLARQCLDRRIGLAAEVDAECRAWERDRNADGSRVIWRFTTRDARIKLKHLYPLFQSWSSTTSYQPRFSNRSTLGFAAGRTRPLVDLTRSGLACRVRARACRLP